MLRLFLAIVLAAVASQAAAGLRVHPVEPPKQGQSTQVNAARASGSTAPVGEVRRTGIEIVGEADSGGYVLRENDVAEQTLFRFGQMVPVAVAIQKLLPNDQYKVNFDEGMDDVVVTWKGGDTWTDVLSKIEAQNNIGITVNHAEKVVGVSRNKEISVYLAKRSPQVWRVRSELSLKENLEAWAQQAGWTVFWAVDIDYQVANAATLMGPLTDERGPIHQLLSGFTNEKTPLSAVIHEGNKVLRIVEAGYQQEVGF